MKIHIHKELTKEKSSLSQIIGIKSPVSCYEIFAWFELTSEEREVIDKCPDLLKRKLSDHTYEHLNLSANVSSMIKLPKPGEKGYRFVAYNSNDFFALENKIVKAAEELKNQIEGLKDCEGSTIIEI